MMSPLVEDFGYLGISDKAQQVFISTYEAPSGVHPSVPKLLQQLWRDPAGNNYGHVYQWVECSQGKDIMRL
jgi:hypothetical protein